MLDLTLILLFVAYAITAGLLARRRASRSRQDYFLAGRDVPGWKAGVSMAATQYSADTPLLATGLVATGGVFVLWRFWIYGFGYLLLGFIFAELWRRSRVLTDAELTEIRYSGRGVLALRTLKAVYYGTIVNCFFLAMTLIAAVRVAEVFLPWDEWLSPAAYASIQAAFSGLGFQAAVATVNASLSIGLIVLFVLLYSATGGLRGVVATDVVQFACAMIGTLAYAWFVIRHAGGPGELGARVVELYGQARSEQLFAVMPGDGAELFPFLAVLGLQGLFWISSDGTGYLAQRTMACRTDQDARIAGVTLVWVQIVGRSLIWLVIGAGLLVVYPFSPADAAEPGFAAARELTFVQGIDDLMPAGLRGLMLVGLLAALASTVDTHLNWGASYWSGDLYGRLYCQALRKREPDERTLVRVGRLSNVIILGVALWIMGNLGSIQATWLVSLVFGAGIGSVLMLRWLWSRINMYSEVAAIASSLIAAPVILATVEAEWARLAWIVGISTASAIGVTYVTPATETSVLTRFLRQVQPVGWWRPPAGDDAPRQAFWLRMKYTLWMTASVFLVLAGSAKLLLQLPGESSLWGWAMLLTAILITPLWLPSLSAQTFEGQ